MTPSEYAELLRLRDLARFLIRAIDKQPDHAGDEPLTGRELSLSNAAAGQLYAARKVLNEEVSG